MRTFIAAATILAGFSFGVLQAVDAAHATDQNPPIRTEYLPCGQEPVLRNCVGERFFAGRDARIWVLPHHMSRFLLTGNNSRGEYFACPTPVSSDPVSCIWEETVWLGREGNDTVIPHHIARYLLSR